MWLEENKFNVIVTAYMRDTRGTGVSNNETRVAIGAGGNSHVKFEEPRAVHCVFEWRAYTTWFLKEVNSGEECIPFSNKIFRHAGRFLDGLWIGGVQSEWFKFPRLIRLINV